MSINMYKAIMFLELILSIVLAAMANYIIGFCFESLYKHTLLNTFLKCIPIIVAYFTIKETRLVRRLHFSYNQQFGEMTKKAQKRLLDIIFKDKPKVENRQGKVKPIKSKTTFKQNPIFKRKNNSDGSIPATGFKYYKFEKDVPRMPVMHLQGPGKYFLCDCFLCSVKKQKNFCKVQKCERCSITYKL